MKSSLLKTLTCFLSLSLASNLAFSLSAVVVSTNGKVEIQKGEEWIPLIAGTTISTGDCISTGFKSEAVIQINSSTLTLGALTRITVEKLLESQNVDETKIFIDTGSISADVKHTEERKVGFKVSSSVATASVRGTSFTYTADGTLKTQEGLVSKGWAESRSPRVEKDPTESFEPKDGESSVFTSTSDVSSDAGIPVYAGQTSTSEETEGFAYTPQEQKAIESSTIENSTQTLSSQESESSGSATATTQLTTISSTKETTGYLVITATISK